MRPMRKHSTMSVPMPTISIRSDLPACRESLLQILAKERPGCKIRTDESNHRGEGGRRMPGAEHDLLADLTPAQREAVMHMAGPLPILAGAGSGKTRVITRRVG